MNKFKNVPVEQDTKIIFQLESTLGVYEILYQKWFWDGFIAESMIFKNEDISDLDDIELEAKVLTSPLLHSDSKLTIARSAGYTFVNFNFETE